MNIHRDVHKLHRLWKSLWRMWKTPSYQQQLSPFDFSESMRISCISGCINRTVTETNVNYVTVIWKKFHVKSTSKSSKIVENGCQNLAAAGVRTNIFVKTA